MAFRVFGLRETGSNTGDFIEHELNASVFASKQLATSFVDNISTFGAINTRASTITDEVRIPIHKLDRIIIREVPDVDSDFNSVSLLSGFNEIDKATSFTDEADARVITVAGNAQADTAQKKFGTSSVFFDGAGDFLSVPHDAAFQADQVITIECFIRLAEVGVQQVFIAKRVNASPPLGYLFYIKNTDKLAFFGGAAPTFAINISGTVTTLLIDTWYHVAAVRESDGTWTLYVDGVIQATGSEAVAVADDGSPLLIGRDGADFNSDFHGWIDEVRITSGVARYTEAFTPPDVAFLRL